MAHAVAGSLAARGAALPVQDLDDVSRSDASWDLLSESQFDSRSNASWDLVSERRCLSFPTSEMSSLCDPNEFTANLSHNTLQALEQPGLMLSAEESERFSSNLIQLIRSERWDAALHLLRRAPLSSLGAILNAGNDDSAFAWAVYKARRGGTACFELLCAILAASPSFAWKRSFNNFLPLHDAAWGNAHPAVATLVCAAYPAALHVSIGHQTPHDVGRYHHSGRKCALPFSWPKADEMLHSASEIRAESQWLDKLAALRLPSTEVLRSMSVEDLQASFGLSQPYAELVLAFVCERPRGTWSPSLPQIVEQKHVVAAQLSEPRFHPWSPEKRRLWAVLRKQHHPMLDPSLEPSLVASDEVDHVRESCAKDCRRNAGMNSVRNTRCAFKESMRVVDGKGAAHQLSFHRAKTLPKGIQRLAPQSKWPSKADLRRQRACERTQKSSDRAEL